MKISVTGAHNCESRDTKYACLVVDDILALDAGGLTSGLSFSEQLELKAVLLTHSHYDHLRDIAALAMNFYLQNNSINVYCTHSTYDALLTNVLNGRLYPRFREYPADDPAIRFHILRPHQREQIEGYSVLAIHMEHSDPGAVGYLLASPDGKSIFYSGDTGPDMEECWKQISPDLCVIETTAPNRLEEFCRRAGHLTPGLLKKELVSFRKIRGYLPRIIVTHLNPFLEDEIRTELGLVAEELNCSITAACEGMQDQI